MDIISLISGSVLFGVFIRFLVILPKRIARIQELRKSQLDDTVDFDDWKVGSPERTIPENALPTDFR